MYYLGAEYFSYGIILYKTLVKLVIQKKPYNRPWVELYSHSLMMQLPIRSAFFITSWNPQEKQWADISACPPITIH
jgi:hypothetical protein